MITEGIGDIPFLPVVNKSDLDWELSDDEIDAAFVDLAFPSVAARML